jgi:hypothetical protein
MTTDNHPFPLLNITDPIPPSMVAPAIHNLVVATSDKNNIPPAAAMTGTESCSTAARVEV